MSLFSDPLLALGQFVIDELVATGLAEVESAPILYHGSEPDDCCPPVGQSARLVVWWETIGEAAKGASSAGSVTECGAVATGVSIRLRLLACWPTPTPPVVDPTVFFTAADWLASCAWVGQHALIGLVCADSGLADLGFKRLAVLPARPRIPKGGCAGVDWSVFGVPSDVAYPYE